MFFDLSHPLIFVITPRGGGEARWLVISERPITLALGIVVDYPAPAGFVGPSSVGSQKFVDFAACLSGWSSDMVHSNKMGSEAFTSMAPS